MIPGSVACENSAIDHRFLYKIFYLVAIWAFNKWLVHKSLNLWISGSATVLSLQISDYVTICFNKWQSTLPCSVWISDSVTSLVWNKWCKHHNLLHFLFRFYFWKTMNRDSLLDCCHSLNSVCKIFFIS